MTTERWLPVPGYAGLYEVSDLGRVRSLRTSRIMAGTRASTGYWQFALKADGGSYRSMLGHRIVGEAFLGPLPEGMETRHLNGDRTDNRLVNLAYGTSRENAADTLAHGNHNYARRATCINGHEFTPENTYRPPSAPRARVCRTCNRERLRAFADRYNAAKRAKRAAAKASAA